MTKVYDVDEVAMQSIRKTCYDAGMNGHLLFTVRSGRDISPIKPEPMGKTLDIVGIDAKCGACGQPIYSKWYCCPWCGNRVLGGERYDG